MGYVGIAGILRSHFGSEEYPFGLKLPSVVQLPSVAMTMESKQQNLIDAIGNLDIDTQDACHRCKERTDVDCFILAGKRLRRHSLPDPMRFYILMHLYWLYWPWPVLYMVDFLLETVTPRSSRIAVSTKYVKGSRR